MITQFKQSLDLHIHCKYHSKVVEFSYFLFYYFLKVSSLAHVGGNVT